MKSVRKKPRGWASYRDGDLMRLELSIARRADMLWRGAGYCRGRDLIHWLQAESEVLNRYFLLERPMDVELAADP
jgi:Protein of unknown function (DUF2934)